MCSENPDSSRRITEKVWPLSPMREAWSLTSTKEALLLLPMSNSKRAQYRALKDGLILGDGRRPMPGGLPFRCPPLTPEAGAMIAEFEEAFECEDLPPSPTSAVGVFRNLAVSIGLMRSSAEPAPKFPTVDPSA